MNKIALSSENLTKVYSKSNKLKQEVLALKNLSLEVKQGEIFGLLGPNGAGKTSLIRVINQIINQDEGDILIDGRNITYEDVRKIGYMPEERGLYLSLIHI